MATVSVRYIVADVDAAIAFYSRHLGFHVEFHPGPGFAMLSRRTRRGLQSGVLGGALTRRGGGTGEQPSWERRGGADAAAWTEVRTGGGEMYPAVGRGPSTRGLAKNDGAATLAERDRPGN